MFSSNQPFTSPKHVHSRCGKQCLKSELFASNVACAAYFTRPYSLSNGPFYTGSLGIHCSKLEGLFACAGRMKGPIGLFVGLQDQHACGTACTLVMERTGLTGGDAGNRTRMTGLLCRSGMVPQRLPRRRSWTGHLVSLPIDGEPAVIKARARLGLPTHVWRHRTHDVDVIARVTLGKHLRIDVAHIHQMLRRQASPVPLIAHEAPP
jgi:hypothetical protein